MAPLIDLSIEGSQIINSAIANLKSDIIRNRGTISVEALRFKPNLGTSGITLEGPLFLISLPSSIPTSSITQHPTQSSSIILLLGLRKKDDNLSDRCCILGRTLFIEASVELFEKYKLLLEVQSKAISELHPGVSIRRSLAAAMSVIKTEESRDFVLGYGGDLVSEDNDFQILNEDVANVKLRPGMKVLISVGFKGHNPMLIADVVVIRNYKTKSSKIQEPLVPQIATMRSSRNFRLVLTKSQLGKVVPTLPSLPVELQECVLTSLADFEYLDANVIQLVAGYFCDVKAPLGVVLRVMHEVFRLFLLKRVALEDLVKLLIDPLWQSNVESGTVEGQLRLVHISDQVGHSISRMKRPPIDMLEKSLLSGWSQDLIIYNKLGLIRVIDELTKLRNSSNETLDSSTFENCPAFSHYLLLPVYSILALNDRIFNGMEMAGAAAIKSFRFDNQSQVKYLRRYNSFCESCGRFREIRFIDHKKHMHRSMNISIELDKFLNRSPPTSPQRDKETYLVEAGGTIIEECGWKSSARRDIVLGPIIDQGRSCQPCRGYNYIVALEFSRLFGLALEVDVPLTGLQPDEPPNTELSESHKIEDWLPIPEDEAIIKSLSAKQTIVIGIPTVPSMADNVGRVFDLKKVRTCGEKVTEHCVLLVSYGIYQMPDGRTWNVWICKDSSGKDSEFFYILRNSSVHPLDWVPLAPVIPIVRKEELDTWHIKERTMKELAEIESDIAYDIVVLFYDKSITFYKEFLEAYKRAARLFITDDHDTIVTYVDLMGDWDQCNKYGIY